MKVTGLWYGGASYSVGTWAEDAEAFASIREAVTVYETRRDDGAWCGTPLLTPCAGDDSEMWLVRGTVDLDAQTDIYPDYVICTGPRGGTVVQRA